MVKSPAERQRALRERRKSKMLRIDPPRNETAKILIQQIEERNELIQLEDGFFYFWPRSPGALSPWHLRIIAQYIDDRNASWEAQINKDLRR